MYDKADVAIQIAQEWDEKTNKPPLFANVNAVVNLDGRNYGLFSSSLGKDDPNMILLSRQEAQKFPSSNTLDKYPQLNNPAVTHGYPVMVNIKLILKNSHNEIEAIKRIGGTAIHEATHAQDFTIHSTKNPNQKPNLTEQRPEANRMAFEKWFDQNIKMLEARFPSLKV
jgi:hypothetical protein